MNQKSEDAVDVIIPTYNGLPWLDQTVASVLTQTHENLRLLIIDDGSTDGTKQYISSLKDKRIEYFYQKNRGQSSARNLGISMASAPFVAFLDSDDIWHPSKLEKQLAVLKSNPTVGMVYNDIYVIDENNVITRSLKAEHRGKLVDTLSEGNTITGSASVVLIRKDILDKTGGFREGLVNGEDWELWLRIAKECEIDFVPEVLADIRMRSGSTQTNIARMANGLVDAYEALKQDLNLTEKQLHKAAFYCLFNASNQFLSINMHKESRAAMLLLFREHPGIIYRFDLWKPKYQNGIYVRSILGSNFADNLFRAIRGVIKLPFRVIKKLSHLLRKK